MMGIIQRIILLLAIFAAAEMALTRAWAVDPNALESAYWRFEEDIPVGQPVNPPNEAVVLDSINQNGMQAFEDFDDPNDPNDPVIPSSAPTYTSDVPPTALKSGLPNNKALDFLPSPNGKDLHSSIKNINNPIIENGFTLEAAFKPFSINRYQVIAGKDGKPNAGMNEQTLALKMRGDTNELQIELFDKSNTIHGVRSSGPLVANQWYYAAVVNDGTNLSLYLDRNDGAGYVLQGTDPNPLSGALWEGVNPGVPGGGFDTSWTIGRGMYNGGATDWFDGVIDEVRLTNSVLSPSQFLFAPPGSNGDHNGDGTVDAADYVLWRKNPAAFGDAAGYDDWRTNFGAMVNIGAGGSSAVPEPASAIFATFLLAVLAMPRRASRKIVCS
jgi:hypothetical protein